MLRRVLAAQCGVTALIALALSLFGPDLLHSALVGAGISVVGNGYAAWRVFAGSRKEIDSIEVFTLCLLYTSPSPRDYAASRMPSSA